MEAIVTGFDPADLRPFALDVWNGGQGNVDIFQNAAGISFPVLIGAAGTGSQYGVSNHWVVVVGGDGTIVYKSSGVNVSAITAAVTDAIANLSTVAVGDTPTAADLLGANYPNPFNPSTRIPFEVPVELGDSQVRLEVLDLRGRVVRTLVDARRAVGRHEVAFDGFDDSGNQLPSGSYLARMSVGGTESARVMTLVK